jgi:multisubunit Na+/H+ antiporter MnhG subunit
MDELKRKLSESIVTGSVLLAAITGMGYVAAYLFEVGFLNRFGIPYQAAHVTTESFIISSMMALIGITWVASNWDALAILWVPIKRPKYFLLWMLLRRLRIFVWFVILTSPASIYYAQFWAVVGIAGVLSATYLIIDALFYWGRLLVFKDKAKAAKEQPLSERERQAMPYLLGLTLTLFAISFAPIMGHMFANSRSNYMVVDKDQIIVRKYGDEMITAQYDFKLKKLTGDYQITTLDGTKQFVVVKISTLNK